MLQKANFVSPSKGLSRQVGTVNATRTSIQLPTGATKPYQSQLRAQGEVYKFQRLCGKEDSLIVHVQRAERNRPSNVNYESD